MAAEVQGKSDAFLSIDTVMHDADALLEEMAGSQRLVLVYNARVTPPRIR